MPVKDMKRRGKNKSVLCKIALVEGDINKKWNPATLVRDLSCTALNPKSLGPANSLSMVIGITRVKDFVQWGIDTTLRF